MIRFRLPSHLNALLPEAERPRGHGRSSLTLHPGAWADVASEIRERFPLLAERALGPTEEIAEGFVLVVNDEVVRRPDRSMRLRAGDEVCLIAALAGG